MLLQLAHCIGTRCPVDGSSKNSERLASKSKAHTCWNPTGLAAVKNPSTFQQTLRGRPCNPLGPLFPQEKNPSCEAAASLGSKAVQRSCNFGSCTLLRTKCTSKASKRVSLKGFLTRGACTCCLCVAPEFARSSALSAGLCYAVELSR